MLKSLKKRVFLESDHLYGYNIIKHYIAIEFFELKLMRYI